MGRARKNHLFLGNPTCQALNTVTANPTSQNGTSGPE
jgi:hypothetical protein